MKKNNIILILTIFFIIISLTTINATNNTNNMSSDDTVTLNTNTQLENHIQKQQSIKQIEDNTKMNEKNVKKQYTVNNYKQLYDTIEEIKANSTEDSETIILNDGEYTITDTINWGNTTHKTHTLALKGSSTTLNGQDKYQFITVSNNYTLNIEKLTITNCNDLNGSVIYNNGCVNIQNSVFTDNDGGYGGVIYNTGNITIKDTNFYENIGVLGSATYNTQNGYIEILNSNFNENTAAHFAVHYNNQNATLIIEDSKFNKNTADYSGGVLCNNATATMIIRRCNFDNNQANTNVAGVCYIKNGNVTIQNSYFTSNKASAWGGVISIQKGNLTITNSRFEDNSAYYNGGVINTTNAQVNIINSHFINNKASDAGAINSYKSNLTILTSYFINNRSNKTTSDIIINNTNALINNTSFTSENKQIIYINQSNTTLTGNNITITAPMKVGQNETFIIPIFDENTQNTENIITYIDNKILKPTKNNTIYELTYIFDNIPEEDTITITYPAYTMNNIIIKLDIERENLTLDKITPQTVQKYDNIDLSVNIHTSLNKTITDKFNITILIDDEIYNHTTIVGNNNNIQIDTSKFNPGEYKLTIKAENRKYNINTITTQLNITPPDIQIVLNPIITTHMDMIHENIQIINSDEDAKVIFKINGKTLKDNNNKTRLLHPKDGYVTLNYQIPENFKNMEYNITVVYSKNKIREENTNILILQKRDPILNNETYTQLKGQTLKINTQIKDTKGKNLVGKHKVAIKINNKTYKSLTITDGKLNTQINTTNLNKKQYNLTIIIGENSQYNTYKYETQLLIKQVEINLKPITTNTTSTLTQTIKINNTENKGVIIFKINGKTILGEDKKALKIQVKNSQAIIKYTLPSTYKSGKYNLTVVYSYENIRVEKTTNFTVTKIGTQIQNNTYKIKKNTNLTLKTTIKDNNGKLLIGRSKVAVKIDGKTYQNLNITNGQINTKLDTSKLSKGKHIITIISGENNLYNMSRVNSTLIIE